MMRDDMAITVNGLFMGIGIPVATTVGPDNSLTPAALQTGVFPFGPQPVH